MRDCPLFERLPGVRERLPPAPASMYGNSPARAMPYCARARSMLSAATRRSRLFSSASATVRRSFSSMKKSRQPVPSAVAAPAVAGATASLRSCQACGTGAVGWV